MQKVAGSNPVARSPDSVWTVRLRQPEAGEDTHQAKLVQAKPWAGVAESADATDLKSVGGSNPPCGFESRPRHCYEHFSEAASC